MIVCGIFMVVMAIGIGMFVGWIVGIIERAMIRRWMEKMKK